MSGSPAATKLNENGIPDFESLPLREGDPKYSAWGLYGDKDGLGTLNRLTDDRVAEAAKNEIKTGVRISLNWPLNAQKDSDSGFFNRKLFHQDLFAKPPRCVNDDVWTFNTQVSSQWDGLRHFAYQKERLFYNGVTMEDIHEDGGSGVNGIQAWAQKGIVGRGVLVDHHSWRLEQINKKQQPNQELDPRLVNFDHFATTPIPLEDIRACLESQGTEIKFGDILFIRSGSLFALPPPPLFPTLSLPPYPGSPLSFAPTSLSLYLHYLGTLLTTSPPTSSI
ncbi:hypothetical protein QBC45DRAFT_328425 [Copromyces sp. CBS 386.78]|nr:hypothetical protein QBC45DRAFT_328425 [Copromyces sp. CBS 386.78]